MSELASVEKILEFWFGVEYSTNYDILNDVDYIKARFSVWFGRASPDFEAAQQQNAHLLYDLNAADEEWLSPKGYLARLILYDQFPRSVYRGTPRAFAFDHTAAELAKTIVNQGWYLSDMCAVERLFVVLALQHNEVMELQTLALDLAANVAVGTNEDVKHFFGNLPGFPLEHFEVMKRFGRYPSRNDALVMFSYVRKYLLNDRSAFG